MNFEHLCKLLIIKKTQLKNKQTAKKFLTYHYNLLKIKKNKLKLGAITFDIIQKTLNGVIINQEIEMRYIRQDTSADDKLKIENQLKSLNWKWDLPNILALFIIFFFLLIVLISFLYVWYCNNLYTFAFKNPKYDLLVENSLKLLLKFDNLNITYIKFFIFSNVFLINCVIDLCLWFNVFF